MKQPTERLARAFENEGSAPDRATGSWKRFTLLDRLVDDLSDPQAYPHPVDEVTVIKTPISVVFLAGQWVYKVKQPVLVATVDFSTLEQRVAACHAEVKLGRRMTRRVYSGVVPIIFRDGRHRVAGAGSPVEYAVCMRRLPEDDNFEQLLRRGALSPELLGRLGERLALFHAGAERSRRISVHAQFSEVKAKIVDCLWQTAETVGTLVSPSVHQRLEGLLTAQMRSHARLMEQRALRGVACDTHGDLRLQHVYVDAQQPEPHDLAIIGCVEYDERLRAADPVVDLACLAMDLSRFGRSDLARALGNAYFESVGDREGEVLLPIYMAYRALARTRADTMRTRRNLPEGAVGLAQDRAHERAAAEARGLWLAALSVLEEPSKRPCLILVSGASHPAGLLARGLAGLGFERVSLHDNTSECLGAAESLLFEGHRVVVEGPAMRRDDRGRFVTCANRWGLERHIFVCTGAQGQSPAGWQDLEGGADRPTHLLAGDTAEQLLAQANEVLVQGGLLD